MANQKAALDLIKNYYQDFYNTHAATNPSKIEDINYFLKWLNSSASIDDIEVEEVNFHIRYCKMKLDIDYFFENGSGNHYHTQIDTHAYFSTASVLEDHYRDVFYTSFASTKVIPDNINKVAKSRAQDHLYSSSISDIAVFSKAIILNQSWDDPKLDQLLKCTIKYPHPVADKNGNNIRNLEFIIWNDEIKITKGPDKRSGGCYVATCVYGSYDCPQVWTLRRYRDDTLGASWYGRLFIRTYYAISPTLVKWFGNTNWFKKMWKGTLDRMVSKLQSKGVENTPYNDKDWGWKK